MSVTTSAPVRPVPTRVRLAMSFLFAAIGLGAAESLLVATRMVVTTGSAAVLPEVGVRMVVYLALAWLVSRLVKGGNGTRLAVTIVLGIVGTLSMVVAPIVWLAGGGSVIGFLSAADGMTLLFTLMRGLHVLAVLCGVGMLFGRESTPFFARRSS